MSFTIKNSAVGVVKINNIICDTLPKLSINLINIIMRNLCYKTKQNKNICEWDFYELMSEGFYYTQNSYYDESKKELVKKDPKIKNHLFWHFHRCGWQEIETDHSASDEISVNECSDIEMYSVRYRTRHNCDWRNLFNERFEKTKRVNKNKFIDDLMENRYAEFDEIRDKNGKYVTSYDIDNEKIFYSLFEDSGDEADNEDEN